MLAISALASEPPEIVTQADYIRAFERRNLINSRVWSATYASGMSGRILDTLTSGPVTVLGQTTAKCLKFKRHDWLETFRVQHTPEVELDVTIIPHPSGRCREYNDVGMRVAVGQHLLELYRAYAGQATLKSA